MREMREKIREYWDKRAKECENALNTSTDDIHLRELEISTIIRTIKEMGIPKGANILDIGCGDGYFVLRTAEAISETNFLGLDYSKNMIAIASNRLDLKPELKERVRFIEGDVTELAKSCGSTLYSIVISDRCLINLESLHAQRDVISQIARQIKTGGYFIAIENFVEAQNNMNGARTTVGLAEIPIRWHNLYFKEGEFIDIAKSFFTDVIFSNFASSYYFATRVIYSAMCKMRGEQINYDHEIHRLAVNLPSVGNFSPIRMAILRKA